MLFKKRDLPKFIELDHLARRRKRDTEDIVEVCERQQAGTLSISASIV